MRGDEAGTWVGWVDTVCTVVRVQPWKYRISFTARSDCDDQINTIPSNKKKEKEKKEKESHFTINN
jgi:hypothetical protein